MCRRWKGQCLRVEVISVKTLRPDTGKWEETGMLGALDITVCVEAQRQEVIQQNLALLHKMCPF